MSGSSGSRRFVVPAAVGAGLLVALAVAVGVRLWTRGERRAPEEGQVAPSTSASASARKLVPYRRKVTGKRFSGAGGAEAGGGGRAADPEEDYGRVRPVPGDANPQVASVVKAVETGEHPERLSPFVAPKPFDRAAYEADTDSYLNTIEPGRVFQTAQPGPRVPRLRSLSDRFVRLVQGETADLVVQVVPGAPVTFLSTDLGTFTNGLACTTVRADGQGLAKARLKATPGAIANCNVLAGCPLASGQVRFTVLIELPRE